MFVVIANDTSCRTILSDSYTIRKYPIESAGLRFQALALLREYFLLQPIHERIAGTVQSAIYANAI
jgi:hypothetical protein